MTKNRFDIAKQHLDQYLIAHQLRQTQERLLLLERICSYEGAFTAAQLLNDVNVSTATAYNNLRLFLDCHIINFSHKTEEYIDSNGEFHQTVNRTAYYELAVGEKNRLKFVCNRCGREVEFHNKAIENILRDQRFSNYNPQSFSLTVYGCCKTCRRKKQ